MNTQKRTSTVFLLLFVFMLLGSFFGTGKVAHASAPEPRTVNAIGFEESEGPMDVGLPTVSTDDINDWTERKGFEIIGVLQKFVQPFAIVMFIGCAILTLIGAFGNGKMVSRGLLGMFITLIVYVVVLYAPEIMDVFLGFVRS